MINRNLQTMKLKKSERLSEPQRSHSWMVKNEVFFFPLGLYPANQSLPHAVRLSMWENWIITEIFCWDGHILRSNYPLVGSEWVWNLQMEITWLRDSQFSQSDIPISCNISLMGSVNLLWNIPAYLPQMILLTFLLVYTFLLLWEG